MWHLAGVTIDDSCTERERWVKSSENEKDIVQGNELKERKRKQSEI